MGARSDDTSVGAARTSAYATVIQGFATSPEKLNRFACEKGKNPDRLRPNFQCGDPARSGSK
jgi:hypothetical protein